MKRLASIFILVGIALSALADEVVFRAQAPAQVIVGRPFQLTYSVNQRSRDLRAPEFTDFDYLAGPYTSTSSSTSFVNGHRTSTFEQTYTYTLMAQKAGTFTIAPATIKVDGESVQSNGVRITVLPEDEQPAQSTPNNQNTQSAQINPNIQKAPTASKQAYEQSKERERERRKLQNIVKQKEQEIEALEAAIAEKDTILATGEAQSPDFYREYQSLKTQLDQKMTEWEDAVIAAEG